MLTVNDFDVVIGIGLLIGLPLVLTFLSEKKFSLTVILVYMTIINAFIVSINILPLWTQVLFLILMVGLGYLEISHKRIS